MTKERTQYLLVKLMEEAAEVIQACSKAYRFGLDYNHPDYGEGTNRAQITAELTDVLAAASLLKIDLYQVSDGIPKSLSRFREVERNYAKQMADAQR